MVKTAMMDKTENLVRMVRMDIHLKSGLNKMQMEFSTGFLTVNG